MKARVIGEGVSQRGTDGVIRPVGIGTTIDVSVEAFSSLNKRGMLARAGESEDPPSAPPKRTGLQRIFGIRRREVKDG